MALLKGYKEATLSNTTTPSQKNIFLQKDLCKCYLSPVHKRLSPEF